MHLPQGGLSDYIVIVRRIGCRGLTKWMYEMPENKNEFRRSLDGIVGARTREATRQVNFRFQHQLIGAVTKRP